MYKCKICDSELNGENLKVSEEMYGLGDTFEYSICPYCECLQIKEIPDNLGRYYPRNYHQFEANIKSRANGLKEWRRNFKKRIILTHNPVLSPLFRAWLSSYRMFWLYKRIGLRLESCVLDVGCGNGDKLKELKDAGVKASSGVDLFIEREVYHEGEKLVKKGTIFDIVGKFDFILFHHSLEHMPEQNAVLKKAKTLLTETGKILIRIPTVSSEAFMEYRSKWYQIDAPRHLFLHSYKSLSYLKDKNDLEIRDIWCDSDELQFIISEQYRHGISMFAADSYIMNSKSSKFTRRELSNFKGRANSANAKMQGDQVCVLLSKK